MSDTYQYGTEPWLAFEEINALITRSTRKNAIVHAPRTPALEAELVSRSDDCAITADCVDCWGTTDGGEWRVKLDAVWGSDRGAVGERTLDGLDATTMDATEEVEVSCG